MNANEFLEDNEEHARKEWMKMRIEYDQGMSRIDTLMKENTKLRNRYD